jgi:hypothetical protein
MCAAHCSAEPFPSPDFAPPRSCCPCATAAARRRPLRLSYHRQSLLFELNRCPEELLDADAWVRAIEAKFSTFVLPCSEEHKVRFTALQLRGEALMWWEHFKTITSRDVVISDVTLTSLKTPEWSQLVFCDDFVLVSMVASHLFIGDEIGFSVIDVSPICDEFCVVMDLNSFYDKRFWSYIIPCFRHNFTSAWLTDVAVNVVSDFVTILFRHNLLLTAFASDVALTSAMTWQLTWR